MPSNALQLSPAIQSFADKGLFDRLPVSFSAFCVEQAKDWDLLFPAEQDYFIRLFALLDRLEGHELERLFADMRAAEQLMGVNDKNWPPRQFTLEQVDFLNRNAHYPEWRAAVSAVFARIDPALNAETERKGKPRLVIVLAPGEIAADPDRMWQRIAKRGQRIHLAAPDDPDDFTPIFLTGKPKAARAPSIAELYCGSAKSRYDAWIIESGNGLSEVGAGRTGVVKCSYGRLESYRKRLMGEVNRLVGDKDVRGPRELSARLKQLKVLASEGDLAGDAILAEFARATLLSGNGTLLVNNTFVEWATLQAVRRAKPSVVVAGFGIRNKIKPFSSLLIYADQETTTPIPTQMDTLGTYVDLEILYQYVWQEFDKYAEYRRNTAYLFAADGMDQMLAIAPPDFPLFNAKQPVALNQVFESCRNWVSV